MTNPVLENVNIDTTFRESWINAGANAENLTDFDAMLEARRAKQQADELAAQAETAETGSKALKNISGAIDENSLAAVL